MRKMHKNSTQWAGFLLLAAGAVSCYAQSSCPDTISGSYGFVSSIRMTPPANSTARFTARTRLIGVATYDDKNNVVVHGASISPNGQSKPINATGTYKIDKSCVGAVRLSEDEGKTLNMTWWFIAVGGNSELLTVSPTATDINPFFQKKQ
jgi:hypothetical protein